MKIFIFTAVIICLCQQAIGAEDFEKCSSVLELTGRLHKNIKLIKNESFFVETLKDEAKNIGLSYEEYKFSFGSDSNSETTFKKSNYIEYINKDNLVFKPAIDAWLKCIEANNNSKSISYKYNKISEKEVEIEFWPEVGVTNKIKGINKPVGIECAFYGAKESEPVSKNMELEFNIDETLTLKCKRNGQSYDQKVITINSPRGSSSFVMSPAEKPRPEKIIRNQLFSKETNGCRIFHIEPPAQYKRKIEFELIGYGTWFGGSAHGILRLQVNDTPYDSKRIPKPNGAGPRGEMRHKVAVEVNAFEPLVVLSEGGINNEGTCETLYISAHEI